MRVVLAADHRGFSLKEFLKHKLVEDGHEVVDAGALTKDDSDDYPDFAAAGTGEVLRDVRGSRGIFLCGSGMGMDVVANKFRGIRATVAYSEASARHARTHDDIHIITLGADELTEENALAIARAFLSSEFNGDERNVRRVKKVEAIEEQQFS